MGNILKDEFVCIDCESTGLDPIGDRTVEVAFALFRGTEIIDSFETLIDPQMEIPETSIAIHNITPDMIKGKPKIEDVLPKLFEKVGDHIIVGHGIGYDISLLASAAKRTGVPCKIQKNPIIDTLRMARLYGQCPVNSLEQLRQHFHISDQGAHRAMSDVLVNIEVFNCLAQDYKTTEELMKILSKPVTLKTMPLGKHKGRLMRDVPLEYLQWMANKDFDQDLLFTVRSEIKRRRKGNLFSQATNPFSDLDK